MTINNHISSISMAKGIILLITITLIDYYPDLLQEWFNSSPMPPCLNIIAGLSLGVFFFLSGITIPFFVTKKINEGHSNYEIIRLIFARTIILAVVGIMLANISRLNPELTGMGQALWSVLLIVAIFLIWNRYPDRENNFFTVSGLKISGLAILVFLVFKFNSGFYENSGSLILGYWELPGLMAWGFLISALIWLALRNSIAGTIIAWLFFLSLNIIGSMGMNNFFNPARKYMGVLIDGFVPSIVLSGHLTGIMIKRYPRSAYSKLCLIIISAGIFLVAAGIITTGFFRSEKTFNNPSWALTGTGAASILFVLLFWLKEIHNKPARPLLTETAGKNFFTAYLLYIFISGLISLSGLNILLYKMSELSVIRAGGSVLFSFFIIFITFLLARAGVRLKF
ncbi:MAG: hypothetical protein ACUVTX_05760 [Bacteroidales bacterium]